MRLPFLLSAALVAPLLFAGHADARDGGQPFSLPGVSVGTAPHAAPVEPGYVQYAQAGDGRVAQLEEQIRQLNGRVEELNFQVLQMQDQLRRMQEDNEFRFQELEGGAGTSSTSSGDRTRNTLDPPAANGNDVATAPVEPPGGSADQAVPSRDLGSITFDADGNVRGGTLAEPVAPQPGIPADDTTVAALPPAGDAGQLYRDSYEFILSGDYSTAEAGFRDMISRFPEDQNIADAHFWLGESLLGQERYREAAETLLAASRDFPQSRRAPEMLFKLGVSLAAMNQKEVACATFSEVGQRYPEMSDALRERVEQEKSLTSC